MLAIRMQRTGRKGHAMFRVVVQDSHRSPTSGKIVAYIGSYDPHTKKIQLDKDKADFYIGHGAQPSPRVISILKEEKVKLPKWVVEPKAKTKPVRNPDKRRSTAPAQEEKLPETSAEETAELKEQGTNEEVAIEAATEEPKNNEDTQKSSEDENSDKS